MYRETVHAKQRGQRWSLEFHCSGERTEMHRIGWKTAFCYGNYWPCKYLLFSLITVRTGSFFTDRLFCKNSCHPHNQSPAIWLCNVLECFHNFNVMSHALCRNEWPGMPGLYWIYMYMDGWISVGGWMGVWVKGWTAGVCQQIAIEVFVCWCHRLRKRWAPKNLMMSASLEVSWRPHISRYVWWKLLTFMTCLRSFCHWFVSLPVCIGFMLIVLLFVGRLFCSRQSCISRLHSNISRAKGTDRSFSFASGSCCWWVSTRITRCWKRSETWWRTWHSSGWGWTCGQRADERNPD